MEILEKNMEREILEKIRIRAGVRDLKSQEK